MNARTASGHGLATITDAGTVLDVWYPSPSLASLSGEAPESLVSAQRTDEVRRVRIGVVSTQVDLDSAPDGPADAYLRLHLLSHRLVQPNTLNLDGIFTALENVVWTSAGPCAVEGFEEVRAALRAAGQVVTVAAVDKFPRMVDYVVPSGVRIGDADRVRLGAHLAEGTVVMHEGFVNYNAGTLGASMVEGRISQGVVVGDGSDIGGGASIMGVLSGGGRERISVGAGCLLGANSGLGISLGDGCIVEAGLYLTAGTKVTVLPTGGVAPSHGMMESPRTVAARRLSGIPHLLYRRNSVSGTVEALVREGKGVELNAVLHS